MDYEKLEDLAVSLLVPKSYRWMFRDEYDNGGIPKSEIQKLLNYKEDLDASKTSFQLKEHIHKYSNVYEDEFHELSELSDNDLELLIKRIEFERILAKAQREGNLKYDSSSMN